MPHVRQRDHILNQKHSTLRVARRLTVVVALGVLGGCASMYSTPQAADFQGEAGGCGNCFIYRFNEARTLAVTVQVDAAQLRAKSNRAFLRLEPEAGSPLVEVLRFSTPAHNYFCDDVDNGQHPVETWKSVAGRVELQFYRRSQDEVGDEHLYDVSVELHDIELKNANRRRSVFLNHVSIPQVQVGWFAG